MGVEDNNGRFSYMTLSRQMVLYCIERRKAWRLLQSKAGIVNLDYQAQCALLKKVDDGDISQEDFFDNAQQFFEEELEVLKAAAKAEKVVLKAAEKAAKDAENAEKATDPAMAELYSTYLQKSTFRLIDQKGNSHELFYFNDQKALVFLVQGNGCPIARNAAPRFQELRDIYSDKEVQFFMLNSNLQDNRLSIREEAKEYGYDLSILIDETQIISESLDLSRTGEVFIIDPKNWSVVYIGAIDDRLTYENQKKKASEHYLKNAIDDLLAGESVSVPRTESLGCLINFPNKLDKNSISYSEEVAPILLKNCAVCHRKGGVGPWAMTDYNMIKGFSLMMREVIRTKRMPPWHADPLIGQFSNDRSLSNKEIQTLVHWIEAGAPRGEGTDPLLETIINQSEWANEEELGPPDYIINIPSTDIPATGVVDYQYN